MATINLNNIFKKAFGYEPPNTTKFDIPASGARLEQASLGSPYYATDDFGREHFMPVWINDYLLPFAVISIIEKKTIVSTAMPERGGTVKEIISIDDYIINVKGIVINDSNNFPEQQVKDLHNTFLINQSLVLKSALTDIFLNGSFNQRVVIREIKWPAAAGVEHAKAFEMDLESDMIFTLEVE